ncbi:GNAT family N-acetyltransferase [Virgibacillus sp. MSJ-26]|uniref:GNAT family N-acetyltransferase n=1 Tax=Virgibacillus sp. MSJ-26 TaxID=2841522 RepID=UPI001C0F3F89|nr:GNAT family protein [Virgibacillus sp. MSJ-26]MBU5467504.1 GNAT family N-acetyltransferase [Virgibacillus sp. MSJ-26]
MFFYEVDKDISLRLLSGLDADELFILTDESRNHLREWLPWLDDTQTVNDSRKFIEHSMTLFNNRQGLTVGIFYKGELAGVGGFNEYDWKNRIGYIGYWLGDRYVGKGIMTKVVYALTGYGFRDLKLNRIDIRAATGNLKSRAIPERLGYTFEGQLREAEWLYDRYVDHAIYGMLTREWNVLRKT